MRFETIADELYGLAPEEFTGARNARAATARGGGDRDLAVRIAALRKPTLVAWLANQLVRQNRDMLESLLAVGEQLRSAMVTQQGPELRRLSVLERELVQDLVVAARTQAGARGLRIPDTADRGLVDTLRAGLGDPRAAEALMAGRLTHALEPPAFGSLLTAAPQAAPAGPPAGTPSRSVRKQEGQARRDIEAAQARADEARRARELAEEKLTLARSATRASAERVEHLRVELDEAIEGGKAAEREEREARAAHDRAIRAANDAELQLRAKTASASDALMLRADHWTAPP